MLLDATMLQAMTYSPRLWRHRCCLQEHSNSDANSFGICHTHHAYHSQYTIRLQQLASRDHFRLSRRLHVRSIFDTKGVATDPSLGAAPPTTTPIITTRSTVWRLRPTLGTLRRRSLSALHFIIKEMWVLFLFSRIVPDAPS